MSEHDLLAERFEDTRAHLRAVAYRMLGPASEADDVQEAWLRLSQSGAGGRPRAVFGFGITGGKITAIDLVANPERLGRIDLIFLEESKAEER